MQDRVRSGDWQTPEAWREENRARLEANKRARIAAECFALRRESGIDPFFQRADIRNLDPRVPQGYRDLRDRLLGLLEEPGTIAIGGERGRGKSWLASALVLAFCDAHRPAIYRRTKQFFDDLSSAPWEAKEQARRKYLAPALLVLDEVRVRDDERQWQDNELTSLIDRRFAACRSTLLLSNLTPKALVNMLGDSVHRRLLESGGVWETPWPRIVEVLR